MTDPAEPIKPVRAPDGLRAEQVGRKRRFRRVAALVAPVRRVLHKIPHPPWRSKRGIFLLFVLFGGFGAVATMGGVTAVGFSETPAFCGSCHTMEPELKAYAPRAPPEGQTGIAPSSSERPRSATSPPLPYAKSPRPSHMIGSWWANLAVTSTRSRSFAGSLMPAILYALSPASFTDLQRDTLRSG